jgi:hypothetical protein
MRLLIAMGSSLYVAIGNLAASKRADLPRRDGMSFSYWRHLARLAMFSSAAVKAAQVLVGTRNAAWRKPLARPGPARPAHLTGRACAITVQNGHKVPVSDYCVHQSPGNRNLMHTIIRDQPPGCRFAAFYPSRAGLRRGRYLLQPPYLSGRVGTQADAPTLVMNAYARFA